MEGCHRDCAAGDVSPPQERTLLYLVPALQGRGAMLGSRAWPAQLRRSPCPTLFSPLSAYRHCHSASALAAGCLHVPCSEPMQGPAVGVSAGAGHHGLPAQSQEILDRLPLAMGCDGPQPTAGSEHQPRNASLGMSASRCAGCTCEPRGMSSHYGSSGYKRGTIVSQSDFSWVGAASVAERLAHRKTI